MMKQGYYTLVKHYIPRMLVAVFAYLIYTLYSNRFSDYIEQYEVIHYKMDNDKLALYLRHLQANLDKNDFFNLLQVLITNERNDLEEISVVGKMILETNNPSLNHKLQRKRVSILTLPDSVEWTVRYKDYAKVWRKTDFLQLDPIKQ